MTDNPNPPAQPTPPNPPAPPNPPEEKGGPSVDVLINHIQQFPHGLQEVVIALLRDFSESEAARVLKSMQHGE